MVQPSERHTDRRAEHWLYHKWQKPARTVKICLQMIVGVLTVVAVVAAIVISTTQLARRNGSIGNVTTEIFSVTAAGLAAAAVIELAYALYTPGPDEALDPLILGVSSTFLFLASKSPSLNWQFGVAGVLFAVTLYGLLKVKERFKKILTSDDGDAEPEKDDDLRARSQASPDNDASNPAARNLEKSVPPNGSV
jgi:hypothetical protein